MTARKPPAGRKGTEPTGEEEEQEDDDEDETQSTLSSASMTSNAVRAAIRREMQALLGKQLYQQIVKSSMNLDRTKNNNLESTLNNPLIAVFRIYPHNIDLTLT